MQILYISFRFRIFLKTKKKKTKERSLCCFVAGWLVMMCHITSQLVVFVIGNDLFGALLGSWSSLSSSSSSTRLAAQTHLVSVVVKYHHKSHHEQIMVAAVVDTDSSEIASVLEPLLRLEANADAQLATSDHFHLHRSSERLSARSDANVASRYMSIAHLASHFFLILLCVLFSVLLNL